MFTSNDHTFVVCAYKENPFLAGTLESLLAQSVRSKIIVSTSTPNAYITSLCAQYSIPLVVNPSPHYAGDDWNYGYDSANTSLVTVAHQDDVYDSNFLSETLAAYNMYGENEALITFSDYYEIRNGDICRESALLRIKRFMNAPFKSSVLNGSGLAKRTVLRFGCPICCPAVTLNKRKLGASIFDTSLKDSCDYKTWVNLSFKRGRFIYIDKQLVGHRIYSESATSNNLRENIRTGETLAILEMLWPKSIARLINGLYSTGEKLNEAS